MARTHGHAWQQFAQQFRATPFMVAMGVAVEEHHRDGLDTFIPKQVCRLTHIILVELFDHLPVRSHPLPYLDAQVPWDEWLGAMELEIVEVRPVSAADLEHIAKARSGDEPGFDALAFRDRVDHRRSAMDKVADLVDVETARRLGAINHIQHADRLVMRRRQALRGEYPAGRLVIADQVRKGAADICCKPDHFVSMP